jgi:hypothetical protein
MPSLSFVMSYSETLPDYSVLMIIFTVIPDEGLETGTLPINYTQSAFDLRPLIPPKNRAGQRMSKLRHSSVDLESDIAELPLTADYV